METFKSHTLTQRKPIAAGAPQVVILVFPSAQLDFHRFEVEKNAPAPGSAKRVYNLLPIPRFESNKKQQEKKRLISIRWAGISRNIAK